MSETKTIQEISEAVNKIDLAVKLNPAQKIAKQCAIDAVRDWTDELRNDNIDIQQGLHYHIEQAILKGIDEWTEVF